MPDAPPDALPDAWPAPRGRRLALPAAGVSDLAAVRAHVAAECGADATAGAAEACDALVLAADELCANVVSHAYAGAPGPLSVDVEVSLDADRAHACYRITVIDAGPPFDPTAAPTPDTTLGAEARAVGGLGLLFVRRSVDAVRYARAGGHNVVTLEKQVPNSRPAAH